MESPSAALMLYTVRDVLGLDWAGTLKRVAEMGYEVVELAAALPPTAAEMKSMLDDAGLQACGVHAPLAKLELSLPEWIDFALAVGCKELVCSSMPEERCQTKDGWLKGAQLLDGIGARCRAGGLGFSYHNHNFEFEEFDGQCALDILYENTNPENLHAQIDTYWVQYAGRDPVQYIRKYAGRQRILHVKDMAADAERSFAEVGSGVLDWSAIDQAARDAGVEFYSVEQDRCWSQDPMQSAATSLQFLRQLLG